MCTTLPAGRRRRKPEGVSFRLPCGRRSLRLQRIQPEARGSARRRKTPRRLQGEARGRGCLGAWGLPDMPHGQAVPGPGAPVCSLSVGLDWAQAEEWGGGSAGVRTRKGLVPPQDRSSRSAEQEWRPGRCLRLRRSWLRRSWRHPWKEIGGTSREWPAVARRVPRPAGDMPVPFALRRLLLNLSDRDLPDFVVGARGENHLGR